MAGRYGGMPGAGIGAGPGAPPFRTAPPRPAPSHMSNGSPSPAPEMTKAQQFADDKRRIQQSCFQKVDPEGQPPESYITHIRVTEDARYPQTPPPPTSDRSNRKERVIILAVRSTGRVRLHKARENANGSFSIGKTWNFEELSSIQSFTNFEPRSPEERDWAQWSGENGFMVILGKPYFWATTSTNEKAYFIASLIKVYTKYTDGKLPQLLGFSQSELDRVMSQVNPVQAKAPSLQPDMQNRGRSPFGSNGPSQRPPISPDSSFTNQPSPSGPPPLSARRPAGFGQDGRNSPGLPNDSLRPLGLRQTASREQVRPFGDSMSRLTPQSSNTDLPIRNGTPDSLTAANNRRGGAIFNGMTGASNSREALNSNGLGISSNQAGSIRATSDRYGSNGVTIPAPLVSAIPSAVPSNIPERRRPPLGSPDESRYGLDDGISPVPRPLQPSMRGPDRSTASTPPPPLEIPPKSPERMNSKKISISEKLERDASASLERQASDSSKPAEAGASADIKSPEQLAVEAEEAARPGLGRMFGANKKTAKDLFKTAANAYTVFKPRAGGAAAKLLAASDTKSEGPDGITGVVPAPSLVRSKTDESIKLSASANLLQTSTLSTALTVPELKVTKSASDLTSFKSFPTSEQITDLQRKAAELQSKSRAEEDEAARRKLRRTPQQLKYLERLGVDSSLLEGRGLEYESMLEEFWPQESWHNKAVESLQADIRRELSRAQTGSWFEHIALHDNDRQAAIKLIDNTIEECEVLEKLLTIYSVELGSLSDDIAYIEAQGQGLQVQTANQKLLMSELQNLLDSIEIPERTLEPIFSSDIISIGGLESAERAVLALYKALVLIDPKIRLNKPLSEQPAEYLQLSKMRALQEKRNRYLDASATFLSRFKDCMDIVYGQVALDIESYSLNDSMKLNASNSLTLTHINRGRAQLWKYSPLVLFAKSLDLTSWQSLITGYEVKMQALYAASFSGTFQACKKIATASTSEEQEVLFTMSETQAEGLSVSSRRSVAKRNNALSRTLKGSSYGDKGSRQSSGQATGLYPYDAVKAALEDIKPILQGEQIFVVDFFSATTTGTMDFAEAVQATLPSNRNGPVDLRRKSYEPDAEMTQLISGAMSDMFAFLPQELQNLVEWATSQGPLQGVGILHALHSIMKNENDGFFYRTLHALATKLANDWSRFLSAQIRAIEDTKVKIKKRKGVIYFMKVFPNFSTYLENILPPANEESDDARELVNDGFMRLNKAMFESLRAIAKDSPNTAPHAPSSDPEDKEALNYHILLIENMNHYVEYVDDRGNHVLAEGKQKAKEELDEHLSLYVDAVIRRPLGKLLDFSESLSHALEENGAASATAIASKASLSASAFRKVVAAHDAKELRRGIDSLRKRIDKHFGDANDQDISRNLITKVLASVEDRFAAEILKMQTMPKAVYGDDFVAIPASREELAKWFKGGR